MGKIFAAALTAGVLSFGFAAVDASAQNMPGSSHGKYHQPMPVGGPKMMMHRHCKMMKMWHHGHAMWVKKCW